MKKFYVAFLLLFLFSFAHAQEAPFITTWEDTLDGSDGFNIELTTNPGYDYNYSIDFGDGTIESNVTDGIFHTYTTSGTYTVSISGDFPVLDILSSDRLKLKSVEQWGDIQWQYLGSAFRDCNNLVVNATDVPDLSQVTDMSFMFYQCPNFNSAINNWDVSNVTNMSHMFKGTNAFNQPLNNWNVSNVTNMNEMFYNASSFNQTISNWDVSNVTNMSGMFYQCTNFNSVIDEWEVSNVTNMSGMFYQCVNFNNALNDWNVSNVTDMSKMFSFTHNFDQSLNSWDVSNITDMSHIFESSFFNQSIISWDVSTVTNMDEMFQNATSFNQPIGNWDVSNVSNMMHMFDGASSFNGSLNNWDVSNVSNMGDMFANTESFNQPLNNWNVSNVNFMQRMFFNASSFNQPLNNWNVFNIPNMEDMFRNATSFNQPLNNWDVSNVINMQRMFFNAGSFNQNLSDWNFNQSVEFGFTFNEFSFLSYSGLDIHNYDLLLNRFAELQLENKSMKAYGLEYCNQGVHNYLINNLGWNITGDSQSTDCNTITGNILYDENGDGCDENDIEVTGFMINADNGEQNSMTFSTNGSYILGTIGDAYTLSVINYPEYYVVSPETVDIDFSGGGDQEQLDFCLTANQAIEDLNITLLPINQARPGFEADYQVVVKNMGTQTLNGVTVNLTFDDSKQVFTEASEIPTAETANSLTFELNELPPFGTQTIDLTMQTFEPPTVNGEDVLAFTANVTPNESDYTPEDNTFEFDQEVVNSFDPNDKQVVQGDEIEIEEADQYLDYIIRFQNTGTASAINVRILDTLHPKLDWNTLQPVSASDDYRIEITDGNNVEFIFDDINLPYEDENEPGSHGFIAYKIKLKANVAIGDVITGDAGIYFDFNAPIITNTVSTEIVENLGVENYRLGNQISFYPNPTKDFLNIQTSKNVQLESVTIYNLQGRELLNFQQNLKILNLEQLSAGMYILKIKTNQGMMNRQLIKQ